jgi:hypothetical protein
MKKEVPVVNAAQEDAEFRVERATKPAQDSKLCALAIKVADIMLQRLEETPDISFNLPKEEARAVRACSDRGFITVSVASLPPIRSALRGGCEQARRSLVKLLRQHPAQVAVIARCLYVS